MRVNRDHHPFAEASLVDGPLERPPSMLGSIDADDYPADPFRGHEGDSAAVRRPLPEDPGATTHTKLAQDRKVVATAASI